MDYPVAAIAAQTGQVTDDPWDDDCLMLAQDAAIIELYAERLNANDQLLSRLDRMDIRPLIRPRLQAGP
jgi:hypothetical protein